MSEKHSCSAAVMEEIRIVGSEGGFKNVSEDDIIELLQSVSLSLENEELAEFDRQTYKDAWDGHVDENVISEKKYLNNLKVSRNLQQNW